ncbi:MAG: hypothetical protein Q9188_003193 [Gyalolechia gomerana]
MDQGKHQVRESRLRLKSRKVQEKLEKDQKLVTTRLESLRQAGIDLTKPSEDMSQQGADTAALHRIFQEDVTIRNEDLKQRYQALKEKERDQRAFINQADQDINAREAALQSRQKRHRDDLTKREERLKAGEEALSERERIFKASSLATNKSDKFDQLAESLSGLKAEVGADLTEVKTSQTHRQDVLAAEVEKLRKAIDDLSVRWSSTPIEESYRESS